MTQFTWDEFNAEVARRWFGSSAVMHPGTARPETPRALTELAASAEAGDELIRAILEALCERDGLSLESAVVPGEPARNYELADRLGIGRVFGLQPAMPGPAAEFAAEIIRLRDEGTGDGGKPESDGGS